MQINPRHFEIEFGLGRLIEMKNLIINNYQSCSILPPNNIQPNDERIGALRIGL